MIEFSDTMAVRLDNAGKLESLLSKLLKPYTWEQDRRSGLWGALLRSL